MCRYYDGVSIVAMSLYFYTYIVEVIIIASIDTVGDA